MNLISSWVINLEGFLEVYWAWVSSSDFKDQIFLQILALSVLRSSHRFLFPALTVSLPDSNYSSCSRCMGHKYTRSRFCRIHSTRILQGHSPYTLPEDSTCSTRPRSVSLPDSSCSSCMGHKCIRTRFCRNHSTCTLPEDSTCSTRPRSVHRSNHPPWLLGLAL